MKNKKIFNSFLLALMLFLGFFYSVQKTEAAVSICAHAFNGWEQISECNAIKNMAISEGVLAREPSCFASYRNSYARFLIISGAYFNVQDNASPFGGYYNMGNEITVFHLEDWAAIAQRWCGSTGGGTEGGGTTVTTAGCNSSLYEWGRASGQACHNLSIEAPSCTYISKVNSWSSCINHSRYALSVKYTTLPQVVCPSNVATRIYCNSAPTVSILSPANNSKFESSDLISFRGKVVDLDGDVITAYVGRDGGCGTGTYLSNKISFNKTGLSSGKHVVYFRAKDSQDIWSSCASTTITVRPTCDPKTAPAGSSFCPGDDQNLTGTSNITAVRVTSASACTASRKCEYYILPIDGTLGSANNQVFCQRPSENLCDRGTPSNVTEGDNGQSWVWTCEGLYGGTSMEGKAVKSCAYQEITPN